MNEGPEITARISSVQILPGQQLTVYLGADAHTDLRTWREITMRVLTDGTREVIVDDEGEGIKFVRWPEDWYLSETPELLRKALCEIEELKEKLFQSKDREGLAVFAQTKAEHKLRALQDEESRRADSLDARVD